MAILRYTSTMDAVTRFSGEHIHIDRLVISNGSPLSSDYLAIYVCLEGAALYNDYNPRMVQAPEYIEDSGGFLRTTFSVRNAGPWIATVSGGADVRYENFQSLIRAHTNFIGSAVDIRQTARWGGVDESSDAMRARVVQITHQDAATTTIQIEQRREAELSYVPAYVVDKAKASSPDKLNPDAEGEVLPLPFGHWLPYLPSTLYGGLTSAEKAALVKYGFPGTASPMLLVERGYDRSKAIYSEKPANATDYEHVPMEVAAWLPEIGQYARFFSGIVGVDPQLPNLIVYDNVTQWESAGNYVEVKKNPYLSVPIRCDEYMDAGLGTPGTITNPEHAIDGKPETYAVISYAPSGMHVFSVPTVRSQGRICHNSHLQSSGGSFDPDNFEGAGPPGIQIFAVIASTGGTHNASVKLKLCDPAGSESDDLLGDPGATFSLSLTAGRPYVLVHDVPASDTDGTLDKGWTGTKFEQWRFETSNQTNTLDPDYKLNKSGRFGQVGIAVAHRLNGGNNVRVIAVGMVISFRYGNQDTEIATELIASGGGWHAPKYEVRRAIPPGTRRISIPHKPDVYLPAGDGSVRGSRQGRARERADAKMRESFGSVSNLYTYGGYREDNGAGAYTGTAGATIQRPCDIAAYLVDNYGRASMSMTTSGLGSLAQARTDLAQWMNWAGSSDPYALTHTFSVQTDVESVLDDELRTYLPGPSQFLQRSNEWRTHIWTPLEANWTKWESGSQIHPSHILQGDTCPQWQLGTTDEAEVVNHITVEYDFDPGTGTYRRKATCSYEGSDDGYGAGWGSIGSFGADDIAAQSRNLYGERRVTIQAPGVRHPRLAVALGLGELWRRYRPIPLVQFESSLHCYSVRPWHMIQFHDDFEDLFGFVPSMWSSGTTWSDLWWRVTSAEQSQDFPRHMSITAEWMPTIAQIGEGLAIARGDEDVIEEPGDIHWMPFEEAP